MEVTRKNFKEALPLIEDSLNKADFLAMDTEFTGLINGRDVSLFDSPSEYYNRMYYGASDFLLIQYGLCCFYWDKQRNQYMNDAYNFYLFPKRPAPEKMFLCQSSSLDFLAAQGFDFNKLIKEGIPYMTETTESRLRDALTERQKTYSAEKDLITIPDQNKQQIADICQKVRKFLDNKDSEEFEIDQCNSFIRRLLFQELAQFKGEAFVETKILENQNRVIKVTRIKEGDDNKNRDTQKREREWEELDEAVGFSKVARMISQSEKLVVGHNMLLDVLHSLNHFFQPVPEDYTSFKEFAHCMFPKLLDTKYMSSLPPFKEKINSSVLQHLFMSLSEKPFAMKKAESEEGRGYSCTDGKHHEAGYDAYLTGLCFLAMYSHLSSMRGEHEARLADPDCALLKPFLNKLFLSKTAHQDSPYMNLAGADPAPPRDHVFYMTFPAEWQRNDINQLFSAFGPITVQFLDETSALVALSRREQARDVMRVLSPSSKVSLVPYAKYKHQQNAPTAPMQPVQHLQPVLMKQIVFGYNGYNGYCALCPCPFGEGAPGAFQQYLGAVAAVPPPGPQAYFFGGIPASSGTTGTTGTAPCVPVPSGKAPRARSNSTSAPLPPSPHPARKRTSSGVFQVQDSEPPPKKTDVAKSNKESFRKQPEVLSNGRRKNVDNANNKNKSSDSANKKEAKELPAVDTFDSESKGTTVSAFKESDSWD